MSGPRFQLPADWFDDSEDWSALTVFAVRGMTSDEYFEDEEQWLELGLSRPLNRWELQVLGDISVLTRAQPEKPNLLRVRFGAVSKYRRQAPHHGLEGGGDTEARRRMVAVDLA